MQGTRGRWVSSPLAPALGLLPLGSGPRPPFLKFFPLAFFGKLHQDTVEKFASPRSFLGLLGRGSPCWGPLGLDIARLSCIVMG